MDYTPQKSAILQIHKTSLSEDVKTLLNKALFVSVERRNTSKNLTFHKIVKDVNEFNFMIRYFEVFKIPYSLEFTTIGF